MYHHIHHPAIIAFRWPIRGDYLQRSRKFKKLEQAGIIIRRSDFAWPFPLYMVLKNGGS
jgi:hypothetical protein